MNSLERHYSSPAPLSAGARFIRGFKRIGLVLAAVVAVSGIVITVAISIDQTDYAQRKYQQARCIAAIWEAKKLPQLNKYRPLEIDLPESGCPGPLYSETAPKIAEIAASRPSPVQGFIENFAGGAGLTAALALGTFVFFWLVGWLCAGFTRD